MGTTKEKMYKYKPSVKFISSFFVFCFAILLTVGCFSGENSRLNREVASLSSQYDTLQNKYDSLNNKYEDLSDDYDSLLEDYDKLKAEIDNYKDQQATINDLNAKLEELHSQYDSLESERDNLQVQVDAKKAEQERIAREQAAQQLAQQQANASGGTVYWVSGGEVYHSTPNCPTLKRSSNIYSGSIAQSGKSRACKVCNGFTNAV